MKLLDLFSGIGGMSLGMEAAGFKTVGFCEIESYPRAILRKHWPDVWIHDDIKTLTGQLVRDRCGRIDCVAGGFPCQGIAAPGKHKGLDDPRSGLWFNMLRLVSEVRPDWLVIENSPDLRTRGSDIVLWGLAEVGYSCWPLVVGACHVGALHDRARVWIVAHLEQPRLEGQWTDTGQSQNPESGNVGSPDADVNRCGCDGPAVPERPGPKVGGARDAERSSEGLDADSCGERFGSRPGIFWGEGRQGWQPHGRDGETIWTTEPDVVRVVHGLPYRVDRITALGNAVVPQVAYSVGRAMIESMIETPAG